MAVRVDALAATEVDIPLEPIAAILDPIVTSATRDPRSLGEVAGAVSVTDSSAIRRDRMVGLHEPLRTMPGVQVASRYGTDDVNIGIRGSASRARQAVRGVAVLLDGVPLTEPDGVARLDLVELAAARQVEVVRGPASALHAGSAGGVVNVVSRSGRDSPGILGRAQSGAFGFHKVDGRAGGLFAGGRGSGMAAASYSSVDGYRAHSEADILRGQVALDYQAGPGTRVTFQAIGSRLDSRLPGSLSQPEFDADPDAAAPLAETFGFGREDNRYRAGGRVEGATGAADASGYFFYGGRTLFFPIRSEIVDLNFQRIQGGGRFRAGRIARLPLNATVGFDYDRIFGTDRRWENDAGTRGALHDDGRDDATGLGAYAQAEWQAFTALTATFGLRYDRVTYRFESEAPGGIPRQKTTFDQASPRLAVGWRPDPVTSVYASVGRGFEVPAFGELSPSPGDPIRSVRPKSLWNYEVGARRIAGDRVLVEGAAFLAAVRGEFVPSTMDGTSRPENASRSRNVGVELGVTALATPWLDLGASYTFLDLRLRDFTTSVLDSAGMLQLVDFSGKRMPAVPRHRVTGEVQVRPLDRLSLGVQVEWQDVVYVETGNADLGTWYFQVQPGGPVQQVPFRAVPAGALVHLNASFHLGPATLFGRVENLFDRRYAGNVVANEVFGRFYEPGSPAWVSLGFSLAGWVPAPDESP
jgi:iron complex outermembrane receptor protein